MKRMLLLGLGLAVCTIVARAAEEDFSKAIRSEDFSAAGLGKLSADEIARLNALVRDFKTGALEVAKREAVAAAEGRAAAEAKAARAEAEAKAAKAEAETKIAKAESETKVAKAESEAKGAKAEADTHKGGLSLLGRAKVLLTPGTKIEYETVESQITGEFHGWNSHTIFQLENGQRWRELNGTHYATSPIKAPKVKIEPAAMGGFWMTIDGVRQRVRVEPLDTDK